MNHPLMMALLVAGCVPPLEPGELGNVRYFGELLGVAPMRLVPPLTDRAGSIYVLYGAPDRTDTQVYVGRRGGGWTGGCRAHRGLYGLHGFVGRSLERAWYWSGTALVEVDGITGACREVLRNDPVSGTELRFLGVAPYVDETPSRRFAYAVVEGVTGSPQFVMIDLDRRLPFNASDVQLGDDAVVLATGAWSSARASVFVLQGEGQTVAHFVDRLGGVVSEVELDVPANLAAYHLPAFLEFSDDGVGVGVTVDNQLLFVTLDGGGYADTPFIPEGVLRWQGSVYVTGQQGDEVVISPVVGGGVVGPPQPFDVVDVIEGEIGGALPVSDERGEPARLRTWEGAVSAIGDVPFVTPWPVDAYTLESVGWLVAGPSFASGLEPVTAVAFVPIGLEIP